MIHEATRCGRTLSKYDAQNNSSTKLQKNTQTFKLT